MILFKYNICVLIVRVRAMRISGCIASLGILISTTLYGNLECCNLDVANSCIVQLERDILNWTQSEECIEFVKSNGTFSWCKKVLESCRESYTLLQRLSNMNVKLGGSCPAVCPPHEQIRQRCSGDVQAVVNGNYATFCRKYTDALTCAQTYQTTCAISSEFHLAVIKPRLTHTYKTVCYKGCSNLDSTLQSMETCKWYVDRDNCSVVEFDKCVQGLNRTLCQEYRRLYAYWLEPVCESKINQNDTQSDVLNHTGAYSSSSDLKVHTMTTTDSPTTSLVSTRSTSLVSTRSTSLGSTRGKYPQTEDQKSSVSAGIRDMSMLVAALITSMPWFMRGNFSF